MSPSQSFGPTDVGGSVPLTSCQSFEPSLQQSAENVEIRDGADGNLDLLVATHRCGMRSSASPKLWLQRSSCCTAGMGRYWGSGGRRRHFPPRRSLAPSVARCSSTSDGRAGSSHSGTRFRKLCRERCPLEGQGRGQRGHDISAFIFMHEDKDKKSPCTCAHFQLRLSKPALKGFSTKSSAAAYRRAATTGLVPFLKGKQEHWTICLQKPPC